MHTAKEICFRLEEIRKRESLATKGPWMKCLGSGNCVMTAVKTASGGEYDNGILIADTQPDYFLPDEREKQDHRPDMHFIAHARDDIPWLLQVIEQLDDTIGELLVENAKLEDKVLRYSTLYGEL